jgi:hypothetical protein
MVVALAGCTGDDPPRPAPTGAPSTSGALTALPAMSHPRASHTATRLADGRVLVAGGCIDPGCGGTPRGGPTELYDPARRAFEPGPSMLVPRVGHTASALPDGRVAIIGGFPDERQPPVTVTEIYDPASDRFRKVGRLPVGRGGHTATVLTDGRVLVVGGIDGTRALDDVAILDPATGTFTAGARLPVPRAGHAATLLRDGRVLVVGGGSDEALTDTALLYDPRRDAWTEAGRMNEAKYKLAVVGLPDGGALVVGGQTRDAREARLDTTEIFDPKSLTFRAGPRMAEPRFKIYETVQSLPDGRVVIGGGGTTVEVYERGTLRRLAGQLGGERQFPTVTVLRDGAVLITGGYDNRTTPTAEAFLVDVDG